MSKRYIKTSETGSLQALSWGDKVVVENFDRLQDLLESRGEPDLGQLFAEPVPGGASQGSISSVAWYTPCDGDIAVLAQMHGTDRVAAEHQLNGLLMRLREISTTGELRQLLLRALLVASEEDILVIGGHPVLTN